MHTSNKTATTTIPATATIPVTTPNATANIYT